MFRKILIADDHDVVRLGVSLLLETRYPDTQITAANTIFAAMEQLANEPAQLLVLDIQMPGMDLEKISTIKSNHPETKILLFSGLATERAIPYVRAGADGYLSKYSSNDEFMTAVIMLAENGMYYPAYMIPHLLKAEQEFDPKKLLSEREYEIYQLFSQGLGNLEITNALSIQPGTVSTYKRRIFEKLKVSSIAELVKLHLRSNTPL